MSSHDYMIDPEGPSDDEPCSEHGGLASECEECESDRVAAAKRWDAHVERERLIASGELCDECNNDRRDPNDSARPCRWCLGGRVVPGGMRDPIAAE